jgi:ADP-ribosylglycohydrolase
MAPALPPDHDDRMARALLALDGLSLGDGFGERFFGPPEEVAVRLAERRLPPAPWHWTDDTEMALAIVDVLRSRGAVDQDRLADGFARRYHRDPTRGYGGTAHAILRALGLGEDWRVVAPAVFSGMGSMGNGAAMRVAPLGAYFADDLDRVVAEARASAAPTHAHPDGQAGAVAVAVAAAVAWRTRTCPDGQALLAEVIARTPDGDTRGGLQRAARLRAQGVSLTTAAEVLGTGYNVISSDTVPYALLCASLHLDDFAAAMWTTVTGLGDRDTTCAIAGGVVALAVGRSGLPPGWLAAREPLRFDETP